MQFFKHLPVKYKLFITYGTLSLVIYSISFVLLFIHVRNNLEQRIKSELNRSNQIITDMVETSATIAIKNHLRAIAEKNREILFGLYQQCQNNRLTMDDAKERAMQVLLSQTVGETGYIYCIDSNGTAVLHPNEEVRGHNFSNIDFVKDQIKRKEGYLEYFWKNPGEKRESPKALYMTYFRPWDWIISVSSYKSEFSKLISVKDFEDQILGMRFGETGYSFIIDSKGNAVIHPELIGNYYDIQDARGVLFIQEMIKRKKGYLTYYWKNPSETKAREKFVAFSYIPDFDWIIASSSYTREVYAPLSDMKESFLLILFLSLFITAGITLLISASITKPLTSFIKVFEKGAQEGWTPKMDEKRKDEFGKFSSSLNIFLGELEGYRKELISEISVRKKAQNELSVLRNYLENIINSMPSILIGLDRHGSVTLWNKKAEVLTGIDMRAAKGKALVEMLPQISRRIGNVASDLAETDIKYIEKSLCVTETGEERYEDITIYRLAEKGGEGAVIRIDDVTEKVRMEEMLIQNEKMLSVGGLAAGMAHEINNPLAGMIQSANLMKMRLHGLEIPANLRVAEEIGVSMKDIRLFMEKRKILSMVDSIRAAGKRIADIVNNMLSFARKSDAVALHDPALLLDQTLELAATDYDFKKQHDFKTIRIEKTYADNLPGLPCEKAKIQQVILNILRNGAQAMQAHAGGSTAEPCFSLRLSVEKETHMLKMEISDNGPGMDKKTQKRIFEPFFTTKSPGVGTGLGLSVSYFIIKENHGGTMDVISAPGDGTTFVIRLPLNRPTRAELAAGTEKITDIRG